MGYTPSRCVKGVAVLEEESLGACVLYDYWSPNAVQVHVYTTSLGVLFHKPVLREIFRYPFEQCGRSILVAMTPADQKGSLAVSSWLGFKEKYRIRDGWTRGVDIIFKELRREDCKFLARAVESA